MAKNLIPLGFNYPARFGLNTQSQDENLDPSWATVAINWVFDQSGRLAVRKGTRNLNANPLPNTTSIDTIHEYIDGNGNVLIIFTVDNKIYKSVGTTITDISDSITTPTADNWEFANFNGWCVGFQKDHAPIVITDTTGVFSDSGGIQYKGTAIQSAGGRLWTILGQTLYYSDLLINTFDGGSSGSYDLGIYWKGGMDIPVAINEFNGHLVVFGKNNIIIYSDVTSTSTIVENIAGIGCIARDSVENVGNDLIFLSSKGVTALSRLIQEKSMPERDVSKNIRDYLLGYVNTTVGDTVKSTYNKKEGFYLLSFPVSNKLFHFDVRASLPDGSFRATEWQVSYTALHTTLDDQLLIGDNSTFLKEYHGFLDGVLSDNTGGTGFTLDYYSPWNDFGEEAANLEKMPKRGSLHLSGGFGHIITLKWRFDFNNSKQFSKVLPTTPGSWDEFGVAEFGIAEFGSGSSNREIKTPLRGSGRVMQVGLVTTAAGGEFGLQRIDIQAKIGKLNV